MFGCFGLQGERFSVFLSTLLLIIQEPKCPQAAKKERNKQDFVTATFYVITISYVFYGFKIHVIYDIFI